MPEHWRYSARIMRIPWEDDAAAVDPIERHVEWNHDTFVPHCRACGWTGKPREVHSDARSAARSHLASKRHIDKVGV